MFCCGVCNAVFTGMYPETVLTTPCGHLFHAECLSMCFNKVSNLEARCPFCTLCINPSKTIKIHLQIGTNWKDTAAALKKQANTSIVNLDESLMNNSVMLDLKSHRKTMLTTSLSGVIVAEVTENILSILNRVIENSIIIGRSLMSEKKLIDTARETGYSNIIIILMNLGYPVGISFIDLMHNLKLNVTVTLYKCFNNKNAINSKNTSYLNTKNEHQQFILNFFSKPGNLNDNVNRILFPCPDNCNDMKFTHNLGNLMISFIIKLPLYNNNHEDNIKAIN
ncbi:uncharacterized protein LOC100573532 isoform X2 [Acyrthosiphon pisum]|uniref:RING-type domain-containing protein n=1 Tax=Acyrthosiphon pisum TaxID=7029 RepID=A0A8R2D2M6_ACYPI|nr:uncharacterized protein LOC100573532 isoform X2 [Acyrthosiphon pisum]|eukprot:XP_016657842.1 PREDICTED: uncharacterized protein LOC100573532 isoform X3 [Acyrthosiphon pisum]